MNRKHNLTADHDGNHAGREQIARAAKASRLIVPAAFGYRTSSSRTRAG